MSRRPTQADSKIEQNRQILKNLVKSESNKTCADCKKSKHPRWASWNLGIFVCIRCSGIHRGMGTHISRVKSVDLDSWTDEQTQSMVKWGNARANVYWEAKLASGHQPSESKIENFIRTKYESKRWVMDGEMPDPSTLNVGDESQGQPQPSTTQVERSSSQRAPPVRNTAIDLIGDTFSAPARPSTGPPLGSQPPPKASAIPPKQSKPADSLLGLDFLGASSTSPSTTTKNAASKADLKQSILSLYSSAPKPPPQQQAQSSSSAFDSFGSTSPPQNQSFGGLGDAFSSLHVSSNSSSNPHSSKPSLSEFGGLSSSSSSSKPLASNTTSSFAPGGDFFGSSSTPIAAKSPTVKSSSDFGDLFSTATSSNPPPIQAKPSASLSADLFDFSGPVETKSPPTSSFINPMPPPMSPPMSSAFNLSSNSKPMQPTASLKPTNAPVSAVDNWGSSNVWGAPEPSPAASTHTAAKVDPMDGWGSSNKSTTHNAAKIDPMDGWGSSNKSTKPAETVITADEDFGGWNSAPAVSAPASNMSMPPPPPPPGNKPQGGFNNDLFDNVWG